MDILLNKRFAKHVLDSAEKAGLTVDNTQLILTEFQLNNDHLLTPDQAKEAMKKQDTGVYDDIFGPDLIPDLKVYLRIEEDFTDDSLLEDIAIGARAMITVSKNMMADNLYLSGNFSNDKEEKKKYSFTKFDTPITIEKLLKTEKIIYLYKKTTDGDYQTDLIDTSFFKLDGIKNDINDSKRLLPEGSPLKIFYDSIGEYIEKNHPPIELK